MIPWAIPSYYSFHITATEFLYAVFYPLASRLHIVENRLASSMTPDFGLTFSSERLYTITWAIPAEYSFQLLALESLQPLFSPLASELSIVEDHLACSWSLGLALPLSFPSSRKEYDYDGAGRDNSCKYPPLASPR